MGSQRRPKRRNLIVSSAAVGAAVGERRDKNRSEDCSSGPDAVALVETHKRIFSRIPSTFFFSASERECHEMVISLTKLSKPRTLQELYAFSYNDPTLIKGE